jgi:hypothetical protein
MGMDISSIIGQGMQGYSQGVQPDVQKQPLPMPQPQQNTALQGQAAGIAANQAQRNTSLLAAVQNLNAANSLGAPGAQPMGAQSAVVSPQQRIAQANARQQGWEAGSQMPFAQAAQNLAPEQTNPPQPFNPQGYQY